MVRSGGVRFVDTAHRNLTWSRIARDAACLAGLIWLAYGLLAFREEPLIDARMYWSVDPVHPYAGFVWGNFGFSYAPPLAQVLGALHVIPWPVFATLWTAMNVGILVWLLRPAPWLALVLAYPIFDSLRTGQIELLMTAAIVSGYPAAWALPILAKITPGVGLVWFVVRREWRNVAIATLTTATLIAVSYLVAPWQWAEWFEFLAQRTGGAQQFFYPRLALALGLIVWGSGRRWTLPAAAMLALPVVYVHSLVMLAGCVRVQHQGGYGAE